jgi:hypothetical protein
MLLAVTDNSLEFAAVSGTFHLSGDVGIPF